MIHHIKSISDEGGFYPAPIKIPMIDAVITDMTSFEYDDEAQGINAAMTYPTADGMIHTYPLYLSKQTWHLLKTTFEDIKNKFRPRPKKKNRKYFLIALR